MSSQTVGCEPSPVSFFDEHKGCSQFSGYGVRPQFSGVCLQFSVVHLQFSVFFCSFPNFQDVKESRGVGRVLWVKVVRS